VARINPALLNRLGEKLGVGPKRLYALIGAKVRETRLPRDLAAIALADDHGIGIARYASSQDLAELRNARSGATSGIVHLPSSMRPVTAGSRRNKGKPRATSRKHSKSVFVVHGRNETLRRSMFALLRAFGLNPIEWVRAIGLTKKPSPYISEVLEAAFQNAAAVVVLFSPDDEARLKSVFIRPSDSPYERELTGQSRPNVLFEAGMAYGRSPEHTVLVQVGEHRPFSDLAGRHVVHLIGNPESRRELATKLENAGCEVDTAGQDWLTEGNFEVQEASPARTKVRKPKG